MSILITIPYFLYQIWQFINIALYKNEKKYFLIFTILSITLFYIGLLFAFFIIIPIGIKFLLKFSKDIFKVQVTASSYYEFLTYTLLIFGIIFEIPLFIFLLSVFNLVSINKFINFRKYAIFIIFIIAGIFSPPDVISQFIVAIPMIMLYEIGILISKIFFYLKR